MNKLFTFLLGLLCGAVGQQMVAMDNLPVCIPVSQKNTTTPDDSTPTDLGQLINSLVNTFGSNALDIQSNSHNNLSQAEQMFLSGLAVIYKKVNLRPFLTDGNSKSFMESHLYKSTLHPHTERRIWHQKNDRTVLYVPKPKNTDGPPVKIIKPTAMRRVPRSFELFYRNFPTLAFCENNSLKPESK